jgi:hypothetical protein
MSDLAFSRYEKPGLDDTPEVDRWAAFDLAGARDMWRVLESHYPGHPWETEIDSRGRMAYVSIPSITGRWKYRIHLSALKSDPGLRIVIKAGGEILERWGIPRAGFCGVAYKEAPRIHGGPNQRIPT